MSIVTFPPLPCPLCKHPVKMRQHFGSCPSLIGDTPPTEIVPGLYVGSVEFRLLEPVAAQIEVM